MSPANLISGPRSSEWRTPWEVYAALDLEFHFDLDVCATADSAQCKRFFTLEQNGLLFDWAPAHVWMNPPYGRAIQRWIEKAWLESQNGATVVALLPASTDASWWHDYVMKAAEVRFVRGRIKFGGRPKSPNSPGTAPFASAVVVWRVPCTGIAADFCPRHGTCSCPRVNGERTLDDQGCLLHSQASTHPIK